MLKKRYWTFPEFDDSSICYKDAKYFVESEIEKSVKEQLISDVPLGAFLSGGIDSTLICKYARKHIWEILILFQ